MARITIAGIILITLTACGGGGTGNTVAPTAATVASQANAQTTDMPAASSAPAATAPTVSKFAFLISGGIHVYSVNPATGALTEVPGSPFASSLDPSAVQVDANDKFVYAITTDGQGEATGIATFTMDATGVLTLVMTSPASNNPAAILMDPTGQFLYAYSDAQITNYTIDPSSGLLTATNNETSAPIPLENYLAFSADGSTLYDGNDAAFSVNPSTGALTQIQNPSYPAGVDCAMAQCAVNAAAGTLYEPDYGSGCNEGCTTGNLVEYNDSFDQLHSQPFTFGDGDFELVFDVSGTLAYEAVADATGGGVTVTSFTVNPTTGALTQTGSSVTLPAPASLGRMVLSD
jgi:6-phosphogluconolactonase (cycloisomerase 2 family)